jgi:hypothetical protein
VQNFINKRRRLVRLKTNKFQYMSFVANELLRPRSGSLRKRLRLLPLD